jgi:hypothetical protein
MQVSEFRLPSRPSVAAIFAGLALLTGCGRAEHRSSEPDADTTSGGASTTGGASAAGGAAVVAGAAGANDAGSTGTEIEPPPADVSGRWALFIFEDPVGVQLIQNGEKLTGMGCAGGTPPGVETKSFCGEISGDVHGQHAEFWFHFDRSTYLADTVMSVDGQRMTGYFHGMDDVPWSTAWLRVPDGQRGLPADPSAGAPQLHGRYQLSLDFADDGGTEYTTARSYVFRYVDREGIASELGSFLHTEIHSALDGSLEVGPVPLTSPELAQALKIETNADGITGVWATTGSAHNYHFSAAREPP